MENEVATYVLFYLGTPSLSMFLQECYQSNGILRRYYVLLNYLWIKCRKKPKRKYRKILSPLGLCPTCQNFWLTTIAYPIYFEGIKYYPLTIGLTYLTVEIIIKIKAE